MKIDLKLINIVYCLYKPNYKQCKTLNHLYAILLKQNMCIFKIYKISFSMVKKIKL